MRTARRAVQHAAESATAKAPEGSEDSMEHSSEKRAPAPELRNWSDLSPKSLLSEIAGSDHGATRRPRFGTNAIDRAIGSSSRRAEIRFLGAYPLW